MPDNLPSRASPPLDSAPPPRGSAATARGTVMMIAGGIIGAVIGYTAVKLLPHDLGARIFIGGAEGLLVGLIPYLIGKKQRPLLARISLGCCLVGGMILGLLLALPIAVIFAGLILAKKVDALPGA